MRKIGEIRGNFFNLIIYKDNNDQLFSEKTEWSEKTKTIVSSSVIETKKETLIDLATILESPWNQIHKRYNISINCKDAYTKVPEDEPLWRCEYSVTSMEYAASIIGYGRTENEALDDCIAFKNRLREMIE